MTPAVLFIFLARASRLFFCSQCISWELAYLPLPPLTTFTIFQGLCFPATGMSSYSTTRSLTVFNNIVLGKENEVSHLVSERGGSRSPHHISLSKTGFDLVLSNSNADSRSLKHEFLFSVCSYRVWSTCPAFDWRFGQFLKVDWLWMTFMVGFFFFFSGKLTSRYEIKFPGLRIMEFGMCPDLQMHWTLCERWNTALQALPFTCEALTYIWVLSTASCSLTQE